MANSKEDISNDKCVLVLFVNESDALAIGYKAWLVDENLQTDSEKLSDIIKNETLTRISWPEDVDVVPSRVMKKKLKKVETWKDYPVKILKEGTWVEMSSERNSQIKKAKKESVQEMSNASTLNEKKLKQKLQVINRKQASSQRQVEIQKIQDGSDKTSRKDDWADAITDSDNESEAKKTKCCTQNKQPSKEYYEKKGVPNSKPGLNSISSESPLSKDNSNNGSHTSTSDEENVSLEQKVGLLKKDKKELLEQLRSKNELLDKMLGDDMQKIEDMKTRNIQLCQNNEKLNDEIFHLKKKVKTLETQNIEYKEKIKIYNSKQTLEERAASKDYELYQRLCNISVQTLNTFGNLYANWDIETNKLRKSCDIPKASEVNTDFGKPAGPILSKKQPFEFVDVKSEIPFDMANFDDKDKKEVTTNFQNVAITTEKDIQGNTVINIPDHSVTKTAKEIAENSQEDVTTSTSTNKTEKQFKSAKKLINVLKLEETKITNYIASDKLRSLPHDDNEKLTAALLRNLFSENDFANCSRTGKSGKNKETAKPQLDPYKQKAIYDYVKKQFPNISAGEVEKKITNTIDYRCKNACKNCSNVKKE